MKLQRHNSGNVIRLNQLIEYLGLRCLLIYGHFAILFNALPAEDTPTTFFAGVNSFNCI
jgi:hypothetical protein